MLVFIKFFFMGHIAQILNFTTEVTRLPRATCADSPTGIMKDSPVAYVRLTSGSRVASVVMLLTLVIKLLDLMSQFRVAKRENCEGSIF